MGGKLTMGDIDEVKKLVIIGDGACGKTCLMIVYDEGRFPEAYIPTIFENSSKVVQQDGKNVELRMWDTAGQEDYDKLRPLAYKDTDVVLMAFSLDNKDSFDNVRHKWHPEYKKYMDGAQIILVGTKSDLSHQVSESEIRMLADSIGAFNFISCSAKTNSNVNKVFEEALKASFVKKEATQWACCTLS